GSSSDRQFGGAQALIPFRQDANSMTFVDLRANIGEHGTNEQNIGIGHRWFNASREWIFGGYGFFDSRESINNNRFNQVSIGAEALSVVWDVRANYYHPIDDEEKIGTAPVFRFQGNRVFSNGIVEEPLEGFDVEVGHLIPGIPWETRAFVGGYTFDGDFNKDNVDGYRLRLETRPRKNIVLGLAYQDDNTFDGQTFATVKYSFGYDSTAAHRTLDERMVQLPVRDIDVVITPAEITDDASHTTTITNSAIHIQQDHLNIDPDDLTRGDDNRGSYENPYESIAECNTAGCQADLDEAGVGDYNYIFVHGVLAPPGPDGNGRTTVPTPYGSASNALEEGLYGADEFNFELLDNQHLIGQGVGIFGFGSAGSEPVIRYPGSDATVILSQDVDGNGFSNEVAGLDIAPGEYDDDAGPMFGVSDGIYGHNVDGFDIHDNILHDNRNGIHLTYDVNDGVQDGHGSIQDNHIANHYQDYDGYGGHGVYIEIGGSNGTFNQTIDFSGNDIVNNQRTGVRIVADSYSMWESIDGPFTINQDISFSGDEVLQNGYGGIEILTNLTSGGDINQAISISDSNISRNEGDETGVNVDSVVSSFGNIDQSVTLTDNTINGNGGEGVDIAAELSGADDLNQVVTLTGNEILGNNGEGVDIAAFLADSGNFTGDIDLRDNTISQNEEHGVEIEQLFGSNFGTMDTVINLSGNDINDNGTGGVYIYTAISNNFASQDISFSDNEINGNGFDAYDSNPDRDGVRIINRLESYASLDQTIDFSDNTISNNADDGVYIATGERYIDEGTYYGVASQHITLTQAI
ncbi:MAG: inverse autotransporter beta domain-containing protein, partial [Gammaproteobacteria bacterium]|nr:inverse autotransporter beta domain-containing protein [Gammaproteobacteria bacterium]